MRRHHVVSSGHRLGPMLAAVVALLLLILAACAGSEDGSATGEPSTATPAAGLQALAEALPSLADEAPADWAGGVVDVRDLPHEAIETLTLIADGAALPYRQDGSTFQNREGLLPDREMGFYREYTVETPGSPDRGARRLVRGEDSAVYYTEDHYDSFRFVQP